MVLGSSEGQNTAKKGSKDEKIYCCFFWDTLYVTKIFRPLSLDLESDPINVQCLPFKILVTKAMKSKGWDYQ